MLIIMTQDRRFVSWAYDRQSGAGAWGRVVVLTGPDQAAATRQLAAALGQVQVDEPLCLFAHGNNDSIGDEGSEPGDWTWHARDVATLLGEHLPHEEESYGGQVLIQACADEEVVGLSATIVRELEQIRRWLYGVWFYGYLDEVPITHTLPDPGRLDRNVELQPRCVSWV